MSKALPLPDDQRYITFDKTTKSAQITIAQLEHTVTLEDSGGGLPKTAPMEHVELIKLLMVTAQKRTGLQMKDNPITINDRNVRRIQHKTADPCPIEKYLIERMVMKIEFMDPMFVGLENTEGAMAIALSYTEKGIQIAVGHNVHVCQNLNIFGPHMFSTFGGRDQRVPFDKGIELFQKWMSEYKSVKEYNIDKIETLQSIIVDEPKRLQIMGKLFERAVRVNNGDKNSFAPLNQAECGRMIAAGYDTLIADEMITGWDLTNWATSVMKPATTDMVHILESNHAINEFMLAELA